MSQLEIPAERHLLDNGLRLVLSPDRAIPVVAVNLWYGVGSRNERPGKTGFAHLFEHMMFQGSQHVPKNGHFELIERVGGTLNGSTWFDRTNYYETVPSNDLELALWLESDRLGWLLPAMDQAKLDNQRDVVKNEKRQRYDNQPYGDWSERLQALMYPPGHPYRHTVIGSMEDLDAASLDDVEEFFRTFYVPNNVVVSITGDIDPGTTLRLVERYFGEIARGADPPPLPSDPTVEPTLGGTVREHVVSDVPLPRLIMAFRVPPYSSDDFVVAEVSRALLGMGRASRLYRGLVRERRIAKSVVSYVYPLLSGASIMLVWATGYPDGDLGALEAAMSEELAALAEVRQPEVERAITLAETDLVHALERVAGRADLLSMFELYFGDPDRINHELERLRSVSLGQIREFSEGRLGADNRAVLTYQPGDAA